MRNARRITAIFSIIAALLFFVFPPAAFVFAADPCHIFHKPFSWLPHGFHVNPRCQNAGLINNYLADPGEGFDAVMTGTSLSLNFTGSELATHTGTQRILKLIITGAWPLEQKTMMDKVLWHSNVKRIFWEIFPQQYLFHRENDMEKLLQSELFPVYLYNNNAWDDYRYLFNKTTLALSLDVLRKAPHVNSPAIDTMAYWDDNCPYARVCLPFHTQEDIAEINGAFTPQTRQWLPPQQRHHLDFSRIDSWLIDPLMAHCSTGVAFDLYIPPLSYWWFSTQSEHDFDFQLYALRHLLQRTAHCRNVRVHAFNDEEWIAGDLAHYRDPRHFYGDVHHYIMESLGTDRHAITLANIDEYEQRFIDIINHYRPWASTPAQMRQQARY